VPLRGAEAYTATAELGDLTVDRCNLIDGRFTLLAPDGYQGDTLEVVCWSGGQAELARESLYVDGDDVAACGLTCFVELADNKHGETFKEWLLARCNKRACDSSEIHACSFRFRWCVGF